jgi:hypothetical protein
MVLDEKIAKSFTYILEKKKRGHYHLFFDSSDLVVQVVVSKSTTKHTRIHSTHTTKLYFRLEPCTTIHIRLQHIYKDKALLATGASPSLVIHRRPRSLQQKSWKNPE